MKQISVSVYDKKTGLYSFPFSVRHIGEAIREWDIVRKDTNNKIGKNPEDFDLFQTHMFDDETGNMEPITPHIHLATGV